MSGKQAQLLAKLTLTPRAAALNQCPVEKLAKGRDLKPRNRDLEGDVRVVLTKELDW
jgi:hypothetical protein